MNVGKPLSIERQSLFGIGTAESTLISMQANDGRVAIKAKLLGSLNRRPDKQSNSRALHGQAHEHRVYRIENQSCFNDLASTRSYRANFESRGSSGSAALRKGVDKKPGSQTRTWFQLGYHTRQR
jgi:hypothetical protein